MAADKAISLYRRLFDDYGSRCDLFFNVDNIMPRNYVAEVLPHIGTPDGASIFYEVKADLSEEDLRAMSDAGVTRIQPGIESLATSTLKLMKKGTTSFVNLKLLKHCLRFGIDPVWNLLVGFPGEGEDVYEKYVADMGRAVHLPPPQGIAAVRFDRFSPYFTKADEYGLKLKPFDFYSLVYPFAPESLANMAYYFMDAEYSAPYIKAVASWMGPMRERVQEWRDRWPDAAASARLDLERNGNGAHVVDSRGGAEEQSELSPAQARLLELLEDERRMPELHRLGETEGFDADRDVAWFDERGWIWREGDKVMSLVMLECPGEEGATR